MVHDVCFLSFFNTALIAKYPTIITKTTRMTILMYSEYSFILSSSWLSGTMECRYHPKAASTAFHIPAPMVV